VAVGGPPPGSAGEPVPGRGETTGPTGAA
jgi:hypothetical protein